MLLKRNITMIGTMRRNKPSIPPELLQTKNKDVYSSTFVFTNDTMLVSYIPKKINVLLFKAHYTLKKNLILQNLKNHKQSLIIILRKVL